MKYRCKSKQSRNKHWHNVVNKHGYKIEIIAYFTDHQSAGEFEKEKIAEYKALGYKLVNQTGGGDGGSFGRIVTDNFRKRMSEVHSGKTLTKEHKAVFCVGRPMSELNKKILLEIIKKPKNEKHKKNLSIAAQNRPKKACEHCGKITDVANLKRWHGENCGKIDHGRNNLVKKKLTK